jgi:DNA invertase Pin-like site-specific DNA recombinase
VPGGRHAGGDQARSACPRAAGRACIADELTSRQVKLELGTSVHDPTDPIGRLLFNVLAIVAEFEADLIRLRTREGMKVARAKGRLRGKQPKLSPIQEAHLVKLYRAGEHTIGESRGALSRHALDRLSRHPTRPATSADPHHDRLSDAHHAPVADP